MSNSRPNREGCASWFKWMVGSFIALLGAGGGIAAWSGVFQAAEPPPAPTPIVITINTAGGDGEETTSAPQTVVALPTDVYVPTAVTTPMPLPTQPNLNRPSEQDIAQFLYEAVVAETAAYLYLDSRYVSYYFAGAPLGFMESEIAELLKNGVVVAKLYDEGQSYIHHIRFATDQRIEVDSCEVWSQEMYSLWDSSFLGNEAASLYPQTITLEQQTGGWYITDVAFYDAPAFCG